MGFTPALCVFKMLRRKWEVGKLNWRAALVHNIRKSLLLQTLAQNVCFLRAQVSWLLWPTRVASAPSKSVVRRCALNCIGIRHSGTSTDREACSQMLMPLYVSMGSCNPTGRHVKASSCIMFCIGYRFMGYLFRSIFEIMHPNSAQRARRADIVNKALKNGTKASTASEQKCKAAAKNWTH